MMGNTFTKKVTPILWYYFKVPAKEKGVMHFNGYLNKRMLGNDVTALPILTFKMLQHT